MKSFSISVLDTESDMTESQPFRIKEHEDENLRVREEMVVLVRKSY